MNPPAIITVPPGTSNREFLEQFARPGRVGLCGGDTLIDRGIARAERHATPDGQWSRWTHAFIFGERRTDGHQWVIESDLQLLRGHVQFGVQENRTTKYHDEKLYSSLAVLDFQLPPDAVNRVVAEGLELVSSRVRYSLREILGTLIALRHPTLRERGNLLDRDHSFFCSALVRHLYSKVNHDLTPGLDVKHTAPEDLFRSPVAHHTWTLERAMPNSRLRALAGRVKQRVRTRLKPARP
ncbi:MAG: hypothetical protein EBS05_20985 [Proteobacteria bacterium]|nr:hypothetical protein [Pseudomonadota bacterium]